MVVEGIFLKINKEQEIKAKKLHYESIIFDAHCDTILDVIDGKRSLGEFSQIGQVDIPRLKKGGTNAQVFAVFVKPEWYHDAIRCTLKGITTLKKELARNSKDIFLVRTKEDIKNIDSTNKILAFLSIEGGEALQRDLDMLSVYRELGVTSLILTWNNRNAIADGAGDLESGGGLTRFGRDVVKEMEKLGMVVDLAHISPKGFWDVLDISTKPFIISHTFPRKFIDTPRNLDDEQIKAVARKNGVIGVTFYFGSHLKDKATVETLLDAIDYIVDLVGPDYVGIGSDFDGYSGKVEGLTSCEDIINITKGLVRRGYDDNSIKKILGSNFLRVYEEII